MPVAPPGSNAFTTKDTDGSRLFGLFGWTAEALFPCCGMLCTFPFHLGDERKEIVVQPAVGCQDLAGIRIVRPAGEV